MLHFSSAFAKTVKDTWRLALGTFTMYTCKQAVKSTIILMFIYMILMQACNTILKWDILTLLGLSLLAKIIIIFVADHS